MTCSSVFELSSLLSLLPSSSFLSVTVGDSVGSVVTAVNRVGSGVGTVVDGPELGVILGYTLDSMNEGAALGESVCCCCGCSVASLSDGRIDGAFDEATVAIDGDIDGGSNTVMGATGESVGRMVATGLTEGGNVVAVGAKVFTVASGASVAGTTNTTGATVVGSGVAGTIGANVGAGVDTGAVVSTGTGVGKCVGGLVTGAAVGKRVGGRVTGAGVAANTVAWKVGRGDGAGMAGVFTLSTFSSSSFSTLSTLLSSTLSVFSAAPLLTGS